MARRQTASEIEKWVQANGGIRYTETVEEPYKVVDSDKNSPTYGKEVTRFEKYTIVYSNNGPSLKYRETGEKTQGREATIDQPDPNSPDGIRYGRPAVPSEAIYEIVGEGTDPKTAPKDTRTSEERAKAAEDKRERDYNLNDPAGSGRYETHEERRQRERQEAADARTAQTEARNAAAQQAAAQLAQDKFQYEQRRDQQESARQSRLDQEAADERARRAKIDEENLEINRGKAAREAATPIGPMSEDQETVARFNPETGKIEAMENPIYNRAKAEAAKKKEELAIAIQLRQMNAQEAASEYTRWYKDNVEAPLMLAAERRAQASEQRAALQMKEQQRQFAASNQLERARIGQSAANTAIQAEMSMLPYRAGPAFGEQMSSAINSLAGGGKMDANASAGINFTADAFEFKRPNLDKISRKAVKNALKGVTPYDPDTDDYPTADYSGLTLPSSTTLQGAPTGMPMGGPDPNTLYQQLYGSGPPYQYNMQPARA